LPRAKRFWPPGSDLEMMEYFSAGGNPPLSECLGRVSSCDVFVVIVGERYGWMPSDQPAGEAKSITWLECEHAARTECDLLVFFPGDPDTWPKDRTEAFRLADAAQNGTFTPELADEVQRNIARLRDFRRWLEVGKTCATFTTADDLKAKVTQALYQWLDRNPAAVLCWTRFPRQFPRGAHRGTRRRSSQHIPRLMVSGHLS
jgi:Domain of unknown function (DUF4062)